MAWPPSGPYGRQREGRPLFLATGAPQASRVLLQSSRSIAAGGVTRVEFVTAGSNLQVRVLEHLVEQNQVVVAGHGKVVGNANLR